MDSKKIEEIIKIISDSLKAYPDINIDINYCFNKINNGFKIEVNGVELSKLKDLENKNLRLSLSYGFPQNIVGMEFQSSRNGQTQTHRIDGFKTANRSYPIITTELGTGSSYKFSPSSVKAKLGGNKLINRNANIKKLFSDE